MIDYLNNRYVFGYEIDFDKPGHRVDTDGVKLFASTIAKEIKVGSVIYEPVSYD